MKAVRTATMCVRCSPLTAALTWFCRCKTRCEALFFKFARFNLTTSRLRALFGKRYDGEAVSGESCPPGWEGGEGVGLGHIAVDCVLCVLWDKTRPSESLPGPFSSFPATAEPSQRRPLLQCVILFQCACSPSGNFGWSFSTKTARTKTAAGSQTGSLPRSDDGT